MELIKVNSKKQKFLVNEGEYLIVTRRIQSFWADGSDTVLRYNNGNKYILWKVDEEESYMEKLILDYAPDPDYIELPVLELNGRSFVKNVIFPFSMIVYIYSDPSDATKSKLIFIDGFDKKDVFLIDNTLDEILDAVYSQKDSLSSETTDRTIYVEEDGDDYNGDGLTAGTAFATINRALKDIKNFINGCVITIQVGDGDFGCSTVGIPKFTSLNGGEIKITGETSKVYDVTLGAGSTNMEYTDGTQSWDVDELVDKFLYKTSNGRLYPIGKNDATSLISLKGLSALDEIHEHDTTITSEDIVIPIENGLLRWSKMKFVTANGYTIDSLTTQFIMEDCLVQSNKAGSRGVKYDEVAPGSVFKRGTIVMPNSTSASIVFADEGQGVTLQEFFLHASGSEARYGMTSSDLIMRTGGIIRGCKYAFGFPSTGGRLQLLNQTSEWTVIDCTNLFGINQSALWERTDIGSGNIINLDNVDYYVSVETSGDSLANVRLFMPDYALPDAPGTAIYDSTIDEFVNPEKNLSIRLPGLYGEYSKSPEAGVTLTNNTATDVVVGHKDQNALIRVNYSVKRDDEVESNTAIISNNGTSVSISEGTPVGDDAGISPLAVAYNGDDIELTFTLDDDVAGELKYTIERTML